MNIDVNNLANLNNLVDVLDINIGICPNCHIRHEQKVRSFGGCGHQFCTQYLSNTAHINLFFKCPTCNIERPETNQLKERITVIKNKAQELFEEVESNQLSNANVEAFRTECNILFNLTTSIITGVAYPWI